MASRRPLSALLLLFSLALVVRLAARPFASADCMDPTTRIWIAWRWLSHPSLITEGVWGPLHVYLIALSMAWTRDPVVPPVFMHILFSAATAPLLYLFTHKEVGSGRGALFAGAGYAFYPIAVRTSVIATPESVFGFFLALSLWLLALARSETGSRRHALGAGIALTLASALRYEGWMLIPLLAITLRRKRGSIPVFLAASLIHPVFWTIGNWTQNGDPLFSFRWASSWMLETEGANEGLGVRMVLERLVYYPVAAFRGMGLFLGGLALLGAAASALRRRAHAVWVVPPVGLLILFTAAAGQGSLPLKEKFTLTIGLLALPFAGDACRLLLDRIGRSALRTRAAAPVATGLLVLGLNPGGLLDRLPDPLRPASAVPRAPDPEEALRLAALVRENAAEGGEGFVSDFFGWEDTGYAALRTRLHPDDIFIAPGARHEAPDMAALAAFVRAHRTGVLAVSDGSRFADSLRVGEGAAAIIGPLVLPLEPLGDLSPGLPEVRVFRYGPAEERGAGDRDLPASR